MKFDFVGFNIDSTVVIVVANDLTLLPNSRVSVQLYHQYQETRCSLEIEAYKRCAEEHMKSKAKTAVASSDTVSSNSQSTVNSSCSYITGKP
jgi:hypothetical protein